MDSAVVLGSAEGAGIEGWMVQDLCFDGVGYGELWTGGGDGVYVGLERGGTCCSGKLILVIF